MLDPLLKKLTIQSRLTTLVLSATVIAALVVGVIAFDSGKQALTANVLNSLDAIRVTKSAEVARYLEFYRTQVQILTESEDVAAAMREFRAAFEHLQKNDISPRQRAELLAYYQEVPIPRLAENVDGQPVPEQMLPATAAGRQLHYRFLAVRQSVASGDPFPGQTSSDTEYDLVHARHHPKIANLVDRLGYYDFILVDAETANVVYTCRKEIDFGANLNDGLLSMTKLTEAINQLRSRKDKRSFQLVDFETYRPSFGRPAAFAASPIFDGPQMIGLLVLQLPIDAINNLLTNGRQWQAAGFGDSGEALLIGDDYLLRTESRFHVEDPEQLYTDLTRVGTSRHDVDRIRRFGSVILNAAIHSEAVERALHGESGMDQMRDYRGKLVLASYGPLDVEGLDWNVVAKMDIREAYAPIYSLAKELIVTVTVITLVACLVGAFAVHRLLRPMQPVMQAVQEIAQGRVDVVVPVKGDDEIAHLAGALNDMTRTLADNRDLLHQKMLQNEQLLTSMLPRPALQRLKDGVGQAPDDFPSVSVLWAEFDQLESLAEGFSEPEGLARFNELIAALDELADECGVEKIAGVAGQYLAVCGLSEERIDHLHRLAEFGKEMTQLVHRFNLHHESHIVVRIGLDSGAVYGSLAGNSKFSYELWGEPAYQARRLGLKGPEGQIHVRAAIFERLRDVEGLGNLLEVDLAPTSSEQRCA